MESHYEYFAMLPQELNTDYLLCIPMKKKLRWFLLKTIIMGDIKLIGLQFMEIFTKKIFLLAYVSLFNWLTRLWRLMAIKWQKKCLNTWFKAYIHFDLKLLLFLFFFFFPFHVLINWLFIYCLSCSKAAFWTCYPSLYRTLFLVQVGSQICTKYFVSHSKCILSLSPFLCSHAAFWFLTII